MHPTHYVLRSGDELFNKYGEEAPNFTRGKQDPLTCHYHATHCHSPISKVMKLSVKGCAKELQRVHDCMLYMNLMIGKFGDEGASLLQAVVISDEQHLNFLQQRLLQIHNPG